MNDEKEIRESWYDLHIHLLNIICDCENLTERQKHDLFHAHINFNHICPKDLQIDWDIYYGG